MEHPQSVSGKEKLNKRVNIEKISIYFYYHHHIYSFDKEYFPLIQEMIALLTKGDIQRKHPHHS